MKNKVEIVNILLTRRCNLSCSYCHIVKNYKGKPNEYPDMKYYQEMELSPDVWVSIIDDFVKENSDTFFIFYGGEPFLYNGLEEIILHCNEENINYTIITNNTKPVQDRVKQLYYDCGTIKGFTSSVDPVLVSDVNNDDIYKKTKEGFEQLVQYKKNGWADDVVAEVTATQENICHLPWLVKELSKNDIYASITCVDQKKSPYYDFCNIIDEKLLVQKTPENMVIFDELKTMAVDGYLIHCSEVLMQLFGSLPCEYKCTLNENVHNVTIDADGTLRLCLRIRGVETPLTSENVISWFNGDGFNEQIKQAIKMDYDRYCKGCNWTCPMFSDLFSEHIINH